MTARLVHVVAVSLNGVIGADGDMPWHLPSDLKRFKQITMGKPVIMGRKTYESIGRPLPGRPNLVVTRSASFGVPGVHAFGSIDEAIDKAQELAADLSAEEICILGGGEIYSQTLPLVSRIYLTRVMAEMAGDTTYPDLDDTQWREVAREHHTEGAGDTADFMLLTLERA
ncbi:MAG: dihydrofolate reductase [Pseudomonadota bacterium]